MAMTRLSAAARARLKPSSYAIPSKAKTAKAKKEHGNYPIPDKSHARLALALVAKHGTPSEKERVRRAVLTKYPGIAQKKSTGGDVTGMISELYGMVRGLGDSFDADAAKADKYGKIENENKLIVESVVSTQLDPLGAAMKQAEKGNVGTAILDILVPGLGGYLGAKSDYEDSERLAQKNQYKEIRDNAREVNTSNAWAQNQVKSRQAGMLAEGGLVKGKPGKDTNTANVQENSFVIPKKNVKGEVYTALKRFGLIAALNKKSDGDIPVKLTEGEVVVPPHKIAAVDAYLQKKGLGTLKSLAPNAKPGNRFDVGGEVLTRIEELKKKKNLTLEENEELVGLINEVERDQRRSESINKMPTKTASTVQIPGMERKIEKVSPESKMTDSIVIQNTGEDEKKNKFDWAKTATGLAQSVIGTVLASSMGPSPLTDPNLERELTKPFKMTGTNEAIRLAKENAQYGMDPTAYSALKKEVNDMYITEVTNARMGAGSASEVFNRTTLANLNRMDQKLKLASADAEMKEKKQAVVPGMLMESDRFRFQIDQAEKQDKLRLAIGKQQEYEREGDAYANLMDAGISNLFNVSDMSRFWKNYDKVSNPYTS